MSLLRERFKKVSVLIPYVAYSAATLLALGADEIVMHPFSNLGPVDPQFIIPSAGGGATAYGAEDLRNSISPLFVKLGSLTRRRWLAHLNY